MRAKAAFAIASTTIAAACSLGVVDLIMDPAPARLSVSSEVQPDPDDPSRVDVTVSATLDPGVGRDRTIRGVASDLLRVEGLDHAPVSDDPRRLTWEATESYPAPGPVGIRLDMPQVEGLGLAQSITMRVRVDVTPGDTIVLEEGEDLVVTSEPPSNPAEFVGWRLRLRSASLPTYHLEMRGADPWPAEVRVPAGQIPAGALPLHASLAIGWNRSLDLIRLTSFDRYELELGSIMEVDWTVRAGG